MLELNRYGLWVGKQTAKGTPVASGAFVKRLIQVGGTLNAPQEQGSENWSDLSKFGDSTDWVNSVAGNGAPVVEATPEELAYLLYLFHGGETVTNITGPPAKKKHTTVPLSGPGFWASMFKRQGVTDIVRQQFNDLRIGQLVIEGSTANKAVRVTPTILSLDPGVNKTADPSAPSGMPAKVPFLFTDGQGLYTVDGTAFAGHSQFTLTLNEDLTIVYADDITGFAVITGNPTVTIGATLFLEGFALQEWNKLVYGTTTPAADAKPQRVLPALGSYSFYLKAKDGTGVLNGDEFKLTMGKVRWTAPDIPDPNPDGGAAEIALAGAMRVAGQTNPYVIDVNCDDLAYT